MCKCTYPLAELVTRADSGPQAIHCQLILKLLFCHNPETKKTAMLSTKFKPMIRKWNERQDPIVTNHINLYDTQTIEMYISCCFSGHELVNDHSRITQEVYNIYPRNEEEHNKLPFWSRPIENMIRQWNRVD